MYNSVAKEYSVFIISVLFAMVLTIIPLPHWAVWARPQWLFMVILFWVILMPHRVGVGIAFMVGLLLDLLTGTVLGQHAFVFSVVAFLLVKFHPQLRTFPLWQQTFMLLVLVMLNLALGYWIMSLVHQAPHTWAYWLPALTSCLVWPWIYGLLKEIQQRFNPST